jgi:hypothetical protein
MIGYVLITRYSFRLIAISPVGSGANFSGLPPGRASSLWSCLSGGIPPPTPLRRRICISTGLIDVGLYHYTPDGASPLDTFDETVTAI